MKKWVENYKKASEGCTSNSINQTQKNTILFCYDVNSTQEKSCLLLFQWVHLRPLSLQICHASQSLEFPMKTFQHVIF